MRHNPFPVQLQRKQRDFPHLLESCRLQLRLSAYFEGTAAVWNHPNTYRPANCIYFTTGGDGWVRGPLGEVPMRAGRAVLMPAGSTCHLGCATTVAKFWADFTLLGPSGDDVLRGLPGPYDLGPYPLAHLRQQLATDPPPSPSARLMVMHAMVWLSLGTIASELEGQLRMDPEFLARYHDLFEHLATHLDARLRVADLAAALGTTPESLSRSFRRDLGRPLKGYLNERLNQNACELLAYTDYRVKEVAHRLGFDDEYYFHRFFRKMNACTPLEYRDRSRPMSRLDAHRIPAAD